MLINSRQLEKERLRQLRSQKRDGHCAVSTCPRPLNSMGDYCVLHTKLLQLHGSAYHSHVDRAVCKALLPALRRALPGRLHSTVVMVAELHALLASFPPLVDQGSVRGLKPLERAQQILLHIARQLESGRTINHWRRKRLRKNFAVRTILLHALAGELVPKATSSPLYRKIQVARSVYRLLKTEKRTLFGRRQYIKVSMQGRFAALHLYAMLEKIYRYDLERIKTLVEQDKGPKSWWKARRTEPKTESQTEAQAPADISTG